MRHDVGDRLAVNREDYPLPGFDCINDVARPISQVSHPNLHVRHGSTIGAGSGSVTHRVRDYRNPEVRRLQQRAKPGRRSCAGKQPHCVTRSSPARICVDGGRKAQKIPGGRYGDEFNVVAADGVPLVTGHDERQHGVGMTATEFRAGADQRVGQ